MLCQGVFGEAEARGLMRCLLKTLVWLHERDVVHRDLKVSHSLLVTERGTCAATAVRESGSPHRGPLACPDGLCDGVLMLMGQLENLLMTGDDDTNIKVGHPSLSL